MSNQPSFRCYPYLNSDLRLALSILYSLPPPDLSHDSVNDIHERPTSAQAHEYLLQFQSRNARRRLQSQSKSQASQSSSPALNFGDVGSTWLSCVFLVSSLSESIVNPSVGNQQPPVHYAEALFAAQTMFHRLRRVKLSEAIDIEFEPFHGDNNVTFPPSPHHILEVYRDWILQFSGPASVLGQLIHEYHPSVTQMVNATDMEERIKGEISMLILANALNDLTKSFQQQRQQQVSGATRDFQERPLLTTLSSALTTIAARIRYTPSCLPNPAPNTHPIVNMILGSISIIVTRQRSQQQFTSSDLYYVCLMAIPDAVLQQAGGDGGAYGRFSFEQRCFAALTRELRSEGMIHVWQCLQEIESGMTNSTSPTLLLQLLEAWAKHVPLPNPIVEHSAPLILNSWQLALAQPHEHMTSFEAKSAMSFWIAIMESGALTVEQVLLSSLVQIQKGSNQPNKKRQSSKSKRRENQVLQERTTDELLAAANEEVRHRGETACVVAKATWPAIAELLKRELHQIAALCTSYGSDEENSDDDVEGGGPVGAVTACATACLPHMLRDGNIADPDLFVSISRAVQQICSSQSRTVRGFAAESLYALHETLPKCLASSATLPLNTETFEILVAHLSHCAMGLACGCGYPPGYFDDLSQYNDDDLENERNDVRDLLRTVSGLPSLDSRNTNHFSTTAMAVGSSVLWNLVQACAAPIQVAADTQRLFPESSLHTFSALAKPINACAFLYSQKQFQEGEEERLDCILRLSLRISFLAGSIIVGHFATAPVREILPLSRLFNLALASFSPMLSTLLDIPSFEIEVIDVLAIGIEASGTSLLRLPELTGPSTLRSSRFDIRGAMRSPGGEDHAGVLTLLRLSNESESLSLALLRANQSLVVDLCSLHDELKKMEIQRGPGVFHGTGVLPKSRRILIGIICQLEAASGGRAGASTKLAAMFEDLLRRIAIFDTQVDRVSAESTYQICETVFDAGAFSPFFVGTLFDMDGPDSLKARCLHVFSELGVFGFKVMKDCHISQEVIHQWNRLRAALFILLTKSGGTDIPSTFSTTMMSWIQTECEAAIYQCSCGPTSSSRIFHEDVISEDVVPPGLFIQVLAANLSSVCQSNIPLATELKNSLTILSSTRQHVLQAMTALCGCPAGKGSFHDPRPGIAETWFSSMNALSIIVVQQGITGMELKDNDLYAVIKELLLDTFVAAVMLILYKSLEKTQNLRSNDPGMTLDGPQGLLMMEFLESYFRMGSQMLQEAGQRLIKRIPVKSGSNPDAAGIAIIGAALFRGSQGSLPPWAVESIPSVYSALFCALNSNVDNFVLMLDLSMCLKLEDHQQFGSVRGGTLLSGIYFENMSDNAKTGFLNQAKDLANANSATSWKRLKALIKQACGGKKKDTDFNQRPALTKWDGLDRI